MKQAKSSFPTWLKVVLIMCLIILSILTFRSALANISHGVAPSQAIPAVLQTSTPWIFVANTPTSRFPPGDKANYTPSTEELNADATGVAELSTAMAAFQANTPKPSPTPIYYPVKSIDDVPLVVLNSPYFQEDVTDPDFGPCVRAANPGKALFVKSLDKMLDDYYVVPFYMQNNELCGVAIVNIEKGKGIFGGLSTAGGKSYPPVTAEEAKSLVEKAGYKVVGEPVLSFEWLQEGTDFFFPFWSVAAADNQTIYVLDGGNIEILNAKDVHPIN